jgi:hypothetical protein
MSNYEALEHYLRNLKCNHIELGFDRIEEIIGRPLPKAARSPAWWSNDPVADSRKGHRRPWLKADFNAELLPDRQRVSFVRRGCRIVWRKDDTIWLEPENLSEQELAQARQAADGLIKLIARITVDACNKLGVEFDMDDPEVARDVFGAVIEGLFRSASRFKRPTRQVR